MKAQLEFRKNSNVDVTQYPYSTSYLSISLSYNWIRFFHKTRHRMFPLCFPSCVIKLYSVICFKLHTNNVNYPKRSTQAVIRRIATGWIEISSLLTTATNYFYLLFCIKDQFQTDCAITYFLFKYIKAHTTEKFVILLSCHGKLVLLCSVNLKNIDGVQVCALVVVYVIHILTFK